MAAIFRPTANIAAQVVMVGLGVLIVGGAWRRSKLGKASDGA